MVDTPRNGFFFSFACSLGVTRLHRRLSFHLMIYMRLVSKDINNLTQIFGRPFKLKHPDVICLKGKLNAETTEGKETEMGNRITRMARINHNRNEFHE